MAGKAVRVRGIVQGVGFRPYIWRLAQHWRLTGEVWNDSAGVMIHAYGLADDLDGFIRQIPLSTPVLAKIDSLAVAELPDSAAPAVFRIADSRANDPVQTPISADAATCAACLADIADPGNRRYRYPFTNCTHCGPRLSIVRRVPYDRVNTSMAAFTMCAACQREYDDPADRRFHAQANCCADCGPRVWLEDPRGQRVVCEDAIDHAAALIRLGHIIAIKGLGGFHLACNAADAAAVQNLRVRKRRYAKPLALMAKDLAMIGRYARLKPEEIDALTDKAAPIVLLAADGAALAHDIAPGDDKRGFMLPYTPLHHRLLHDLQQPIVLTSGNISDEPQCIANAAARSQLAGIADFWLMHDRDIVNRLDDSVARLMAGRMRLLRRARGYCPEALPLPTGFADTDGILAMGAELKNSFCLVSNGQAIVSQHIGDLESAAVMADYRATLALYRNLYDFTPTRIAVDRHPGYLSTQYGHTLAADCREVTHHHAHLAACLAEYGVPLAAPPVLAALFDGLGVGDDGRLWGGEFLRGDYAGCTRLGYFQPIALPGGAQAMREPWRNLYAQLRHYFCWPQLSDAYAELDCIALLAAKPLATLDAMIDNDVNSPTSSSCGRWFDAFAAALGLYAEKIAYEGQAAIALEILATPAYRDERPYADAWRCQRQHAARVLDWQGLWRAVLDDLKRDTDKARIAARIHHSLAAATVAMLMLLDERNSSATIVLSGGVFQNRLLLEAVTAQLQARGKTVLSPQRYPVNDGGIALGQALCLAAKE